MYLNQYLRCASRPVTLLHAYRHVRPARELAGPSLLTLCYKQSSPGETVRPPRVIDRASVHHRGSGVLVAHVGAVPYRYLRLRGAVVLRDVPEKFRPAAAPLQRV